MTYDAAAARCLSVWRYWPQLAACYLLGLLGRRGAIELAAWAGYDNDLWASLIMPLAGLARLGSYVGDVPGAAAGDSRSWPHFRVVRCASVDVFATVIVPFFAIYLAWQLFREDWLAFESRALDYRVGEAMTTPGVTELHPDSLPVSTVTWVVIAVALSARYVLSLFKDGLPRWVLAVRVYIDALWVFLVLTLRSTTESRSSLDPAGWLAQRRIVLWFNDTRAELFSHVRPLEARLGRRHVGVAHGVRRRHGAAAVAGRRGHRLRGDPCRTGVATARQFARDRASVVAGAARRPQQARAGGWKRLPGRVRRELGDYAGSQLGSSRPSPTPRACSCAAACSRSRCTCSAISCWRGSTCRAASTAPNWGPAALFRGMAWALGPHPQTFWNGVYDALTLTSHLIVEPLRICLIAVTLGYCLQRQPAAATPAAEPGSPTPTR